MTIPHPSFLDFLFLGLLPFISLYLAVLFLASDKHVSDTLTCFEKKVTGIAATVQEKKNNSVLPINQLHSKNIAS